MQRDLKTFVLIDVPIDDLHGWAKCFPHGEKEIVAVTHNNPEPIFKYLL